VLEAPLKFEPDGKTYRFSAVATGKPIADTVLPTVTASPGRSEDGRQLPMPFEMASPSIPSWNQIAAFLESMRQLRDSSGFAA
jgi:hypothetical protein